MNKQVEVFNEGILSLTKCMDTAIQGIINYLKADGRDMGFIKGQLYIIVHNNLLKESEEKEEQ